MEFDRILVATDFSAVSGNVLSKARALVASRGTIVLLHVVDPDVLGLAVGRLTGEDVAVLRIGEQLEAAASDQLATLAKSSGLAPGRELQVGFGRPAECIVAASERDQTDAIVVGAHARSAVGRLFLGSVAEEVARTSHVPVLVVRERAARASHVERVVVAIDLAAHVPAIDVLRAGDDLARRLGARLEVVHVVEPLVTVGPVIAAEAAGFEVTTVAELVATARCELDSLVTSTTSRKDIVTTVLEGRAAGEVARAATPHDVIVCGTHGRSLLGRLAFGSVAIGLLRRAPCPVLVVRPRIALSPAGDDKSGAASQDRNGPVAPFREMRAP